MGPGPDGAWGEECEDLCGTLEQIQGGDFEEGEEHSEGDNSQHHASLVENVDIQKEFQSVCECGGDIIPGLDYRALPGDLIEMHGKTAHCPTICWIGEDIIDLLYDHIFVDKDDA